MINKIAGLVAPVAAIVAMPASAASLNLIANGGFETTTVASSRQFQGNEVSGWSNEAKPGQYTGMGYNFLIRPGTADTTGFTSLGGNLDYLYGPGGKQQNGGNAQWNGNNFSANGLTVTSPSGGNYLLADGDTGFHGTISQTVNGLTIGQLYALTFEWAGASWGTTPGNTTERFDVTFGGLTKSTETVTLTPKGFSGWRTASMNFIAGSTSQTLGFLAQGTPNGLPPSLLLDNVSLTAVVPEPATWAMMLVGFAMVGASARYRRRNIKVVIA